MNENTQSITIVLYEPEIPPNTGNLIRLSANAGVQLHLVEPLGFSMDTKALRRAGLDYQETARVTCHPDLAHCFDMLQVEDTGRRVFAVSTRGSVGYCEPTYQRGDIFLFGPETRGLPTSVLDDARVHATVKIPMKPDSRSLNLSNAAAIITFEALRQIGFPDLS